MATYTHAVIVVGKHYGVTNHSAYSLDGARAIARHLGLDEVAYIFDLNGGSRPVETHSYVAAAA